MSTVILRAAAALVGVSDDNFRLFVLVHNDEDQRTLSLEYEKLRYFSNFHAALLLLGGLAVGDFHNCNGIN